MQCLSPQKVAIGNDGKITFSTKNYNKERPTFQIPCSKCIPCRLNYAREWATRSIHEAQMYDHNIFLTLTYNDENVPQQLPKIHFQQFMKSLRQKIFRDFIKIYGKENWKLLSISEKKETLKPYKIGVIYVGEYGEQTKRPHWHAIIFNYTPNDKKHKYVTHAGEKVFTSETIDSLWTKGNSEIGSVTYQSAGYVCRYSLKKLAHGHDGKHNFNPVVGRSNHQAIGKKWIEKYHDQTFQNGYIIIDAKKAPIPKYYERWLLKHHPQKYLNYYDTLKKEKSINAEKLELQDKIQYSNDVTRRNLEINGKGYQTITKKEVRTKIILDKMSRLHKQKEIK